MSAKKSISNTFTVNTIIDGESAPYYFQEWFAWSNDASTSGVTTPPTIGGSWATSIPAQGSYAYLWRKSIRYVWNENTRRYSEEAAQYFRMSGTNGTSINTKGTIKVAITASGTFPTAGFSSGDLGIKQGDSYIWKFNGSSWSHVSSASSNGDSYTMTKDCTIDLDGDGTPENIKGHLIQWSTEASKWIDLGQFKGESGVTYYTHIAWATKVNYNSSGEVTSVEGFTPDKSPNDTTHLWMGVWVNESSGVDPSDATSYTWSYTKGVQGNAGKDAVLQELLPSLDAISFARLDDGSLSPDNRSLSLSIKKTQGGVTTIQTLAEANLTIRWSASSMPATASDGNNWGNGTSTGISWNSITMNIASNASASNIYIAAFKFVGVSTYVLVDRETIPVIKDGKHGTSPYFANLNNKMDAIQCKHDGGVIADQTVSTVISMWKGSAVEPFAVDNIYRNGTQLMWDGNNNGVWPRILSGGTTLAIEFDTNASISNIDDFKITIHSTNDTSVTRELHFTINGVRSNAIYRLVPSHSQIVKKKDGTYEPSVNITCSVEKNENGSTSTPSSSEYTLEKSVNGNPYEEYSATAPSSITSDLKFRLTVDGVVVDLETIPLVSDGNKGDNGDDAPAVFANPEKITIQCNPNGSVKAQVSTTIAFTFKVGTHSATIISYAVATPPSGVTVNESSSTAPVINVSTSATASGMANGVTFTVVGSYDGKNYSAEVTVALIGSTQGEQGGTGPRGKIGRFFYYAGAWNDFASTDDFDVTDAQAPYFSYNNGYWVFNPETNGTYTKQDMGTPSSSSSNWEMMTNDFKYIITEAIFSNFAKLASAIFSGDWMLSQYGVPSRVISNAEKNLVYMCVEVDGQYPVSDLATLLDDADLWDEYKDYGYSDSELETVADICKWAVSAMPSNSDDVRYNAIQTISTTSYQLFGLNQSNLFSVFEPNISFDFLRGKAYLNDCNVKGNLTGRVSTPFTRIKNSSDWNNYGVETTDDYGYTRHYLFINGMPTWNVQVEYMSGNTKVIRRLILPVITRETLGVEIKIVNVSGDTITVEGKPEKSTYMSYGSYLLDGIQTNGYSNDQRTIEMDNQTMLKFVSVEIPTQYGEYGWIAIGEPQTIKSQV